MRRVLVLLLLAAAAAFALAACADGEGLVVRAEFDDVVDLATRSHAKIADVSVGVITDIELTEDHRALVTMRLDEDVELPTEVRAQLRKTNVLGERFVELIPDPQGGGTFESGTVITDTRSVPELEEVVFAGSDLLAAVAADRIAVALEAGAEGLGGRGETLNNLLDGLTEVVSTYDANSEDLVRLVDSLEAFLADVGPEAALHGRALEELAQATRVLEQEDERLLDTLEDVRALSRTGTDIIRTHRTRIDRFFTQLDAVLAEVTAREEDLEALLPDLAMHNRHTFRGVNAEFAQVVLDFIVCGVNDEPGNPVRDCGETAPSGRERPEPREPQGAWSEAGGRQP